MNRVFRILWSVATQTWQAVPEHAKTAGKSSNTRQQRSVSTGALASIVMGLMLSSGSGAQSPPPVTQLPTGGTVVRGNASISQTATAQAANMVVTQTSQRAVLNWNSFNVGQAASVHFAQPNAQAVTLNRVNDANPSQIFGRITAPGQVYLSNANGVYFSPTSSVDVGGLVATTHHISDDNFMAGKALFERNGAIGKVTNEGSLTAGLDGYIAMLAPEVQNAGVILARAGTVVMASGENITLNLVGSKSLASITTTASTMASLVENKLAVLAPDGQIILSSIAANKLQGGIIKNSGSLEANSLVNKGGKIVLEGNDITLTRNSKIESKGATGGGAVLVGGDWQGSGDIRAATQVTMQTGATINASATDRGDGGKVVLWSDTTDANARTQVQGKIVAQGGPQGGNGGQVETSGHLVDIAGVSIDTNAPTASSGLWLIDPYNYTIGSTEASAIATALGSGSVTITTANHVVGYGSNGAIASSGDITINSPITWSANNKLTLSANRNININAAITANGTTSNAGVALIYNLGNIGGDYNFGLTSSGSGSNLAANFSGSINFGNTAASFSTQNSSAATKQFTLINTLNTSSSFYCTSAVTCDPGNTTNFALANNIDATTFVNGATKYNNLRGTSTSGYNGTFTGLGHTISKLSLGNAGTSYVGMFYSTNSAAVVRDLRLSGATIVGNNYVGSLVGNANSTLTLNNVVVDSVSATSSVIGGSYVGGLIGATSSSGGTLTNAYVLNTNVNGSSYVGGMIGRSYLTTTNAHKTGNVTGSSGLVGGLFGYSNSTLSSVDSVGDVSGVYSVGGLVGEAAYSNISNAFALGSVSGSGYQVGGLIGNYLGGTLTSASAGGASKTVSGTYYVGGLIGRAGTNTTSISNSSFAGTSISATGTTTAITTSDSVVGGIIGFVNGSATLSNTSMTDATVTGVGNLAGGLVGYASSSLNISSSYAKNTTITATGYVGGLAGSMGSPGGVNGGSILNSYFEGTMALTGSSKINYGGLTGYMVPGTWLSNSYYNIDTSTIDGNKVVTPGGLFSAQYNAWAAPGVNPDNRVPLSNIGSYLTQDVTDNSYVIDTTLRPADLSNMLAFIESSSSGGVNGYSFKLGANLDMSAASIPYIPYFGATAFKGNSFSVNNFSFNRPTSGVGFLGMVHNSTLSNLNVNSVAYAGQTVNTVNARDYVGTAIGSLYGGTIDSATATLSAKVNAQNFTGGLAGYVGQGVIYNTSSVQAPATASSVTGLNKTGGLVGWMDSVAASNLSSNLPVTGSSQVGGLVGYLKSDFTTSNANVTSNSATGLTASGNVIATSTSVGGLIGEVTGTSTAGIYTLANSSATGTVTNSGNITYFMGGLIGTLSGGVAYTNLQSSGAVTQTSNAYSYGYVGGLIGYASASTTISNSFSTSTVASTGYHTGGLIGYSSAASLSNSYATGSVTSTNYNVGGLVGFASGGGTFNSTYATGNVSGTYNVGGLLGSAAVNVTNAYASGNVTGTALNTSNTGGLIGYLSANTLLDSQYITGRVIGVNAVGGVVGASASNTTIRGVFTAQPVTGSQDYVGGLVGKLGGTLSSSSNAVPLANGVLMPYSTSAVTGRYDVGGLVGRADTTAVISNAYFAGSVVADVNYGGILGYLTPGAQVTNAHYNIDTVSITGFTPANPTTRVPVTGLITAGGLFNDQNQYTTWFNAGALSGLTLNGNNAAATFSSAPVDANGFYTLSTTQDLRNYLGFSDQTGLKFKLGNSIDLSNAAGLYIPYVSGSFDPNGKSITNLNLSQFTSNLGFIGHLQGSVTITPSVVADLTVTDSAVLGKTNVGLAVGSTYRRGLTFAAATPATTGSVTGSDVVYAVDPADNSVSGKSNVGGIVGYAVGASSAFAVLTGAAVGTSASSASVVGGSDVGGLIGRLWNGTVTNTTSTGTVTGTVRYAGGLIGFSDTSTVVNNVSHTTGLVSGVNSVGGLIGQSAGAIGSAGSSTFATSKVEATGTQVGGLIGSTTAGSVTNATASGDISGPSDTSVSSLVGGLIGQATSTAISTSSYTGASIKAIDYIGGLVGATANGSTSITTSSVSASTYVRGVGGNVGGLVGQSYGPISNSSSSANVSGTSNVGGLVGYNLNTISNSTATNALTGSYTDASGTYSFGVKGTSQVGGLVGFSNYNSGSAITNSTANTSVLGLGSDTGGFIGQLWVGTISGSGSSGKVYGTNETGGFVGQILNTAAINTSYSNVDVNNIRNTLTLPAPTANSQASKTGGFVGFFNTYSGNITSSRAAGSVKGSYSVGGFAGYLSNTSSGSGSISNSYATGMVTATGDSAGGFAGYVDSNFTGSVSNVYAMGAVNGVTNVGGLIGYADRGTFNSSYSTGYVNSSGASVGGSFGGLNSALLTSPSTYRVVRNNLYFDTTTSNRSADATGGGGTGAATGLATSALQGVLPHTNFSTGTWGTGVGLYPYLKTFYPSTPQAISGIAMLSNGSVAAQAQIGLYANGLLLNGGTASSGVNGYYYEIVGSGALRTDSTLSITSTTKLGANLTPSGQTNVAGMVYSDAQTLTSNNLSLVDGGTMVGLKAGLTRQRTGAMSATALNTDLDNTFGATNRALFSTSLPTRSSLELTVTAASFDLNTPLSYSDSGISNAGLITVTSAGANTNVTLSGGTISSSKEQAYNSALTLGSNQTLTGTSINANSTLAGNGKNLNIVGTGSVGTGNFNTGGVVTNVAQLSVAGDSTLGANVTTSGTQTYSGNVLMKTAATNLSSITAPSTGADITILGNLGTTQSAHNVQIQAGIGTLTINGSVGTGTGINSFTASGANLWLQGIDALQSVSLSPSTAGSVGAISGPTTTLTMAGAGTLTLTANNSYGGNTTISNGTLKLGAAGQLNSGNYGANIYIENGAQLQDSSAINQTLSGVISGPGGIRKDTYASSSLTLAGNNSFSGTTTIAAGPVLLNHANALGATSGYTVVHTGGTLDVSGQTLGAEPISLDGGAITVSSADGSLSGPVTLSGNSLLNAASGKQLSVSGVITSAGNGLVVNGAGTFELSNTANTISTVASGSGIGGLSLRNNAALSVGTVNAGGTSYSGLSSTGNILVRNTAALSLDAPTTSSSGEIDWVASRVVNNAGSTALQTSAGKNWRVWSTNAAPFSGAAGVGDLVADLPANYIQYNATYGSSTIQGTGKGLLYTLNPADVSASLTGIVTKTYDGLSQVSVSANNYSIVGLINGDQLAAVLPTQSVMVDSVTGHPSPGVGTGKRVIVSGMSVLGINAGKTVYGYRMSTPLVEGNIGEVVPAPLLLTVSKTYDATTQFVATNGYTLTGMVNNESAPSIVSGSANTSNPNAATYTSFNNSSFVLNNPNYMLPLTNVSATINKAPIGIEMTANYTGSTTVTPSSVNVFGLVGNETIVPTSVQLNDKNVAANGSNYVTALLSGTGSALASNYTFVPAYNPTPNTGSTNTITLFPTALTVTANAVTQNYNGTNFSGGGGVNYSGLLGTDTAASLGGALTYSGSSQGARHVGTYAITPGGLTSTNYALNYVSGVLTITPRTVSFSAIKTYDGTTSLSGNQVNVATGVGTEVLGYSNATVSDAHVATGGKFINAITLADGTAGAGTTAGLASDYQLPALNAANAPVTITPRTVSLSASKTYDGTTALSGNQVGITTGVGTEVLGYSNATASNAHVATAGKFINAITLADGTAGAGTTAGLASDYQLPPLNAAHAPVTITPRTVSLSASKTYDGTTALSGNQAGITTGVGTEVLGYSNATASDAHVATAGKFINAITLADGIAGAGITAGLASDYQLPVLNAANAPVTITPRMVSLSASKIYDGNVTLSGNQVSVTTGVGSEVLGYTNATANDAHVATASKFITAITLADGTAGAGTSAGLASDYQLPALNVANAPVTITPRTVSLNASKIYDGDTILSGNQVSITTGVGSEVLGYTNATVNDAHVATIGKFINAITLADGTAGAGTTAGLSSDYQLPVLNAANAPATITPKILTAALTNTGVTKTYDGTTDSPTGFTPTFTVTGYVADDSSATLSQTNAAFNDANVVGANKLIVSGLRLNTLTSPSKNSSVSDYALDASSKDIVASITPKDLRVIANNDAMFFADTPTPGYKGVSYVGFVNGQTAASLGFAPTISNSVPPADYGNPGTYAGALTPGGISSTNYNVIPVAGNFTVLPADNLLVKVTSISTVYGTDPIFTIESAAFKYNDATLGVRTMPLTVASTGINSYRVVDSLGGWATFSLAPDVGGLISTSGKAKVGVYNLLANGLVNQSRFTALTVAGTDTVTPKSVTATSSGIHKAYDGNSTASVNLSMASYKVGADDVSTTYTSANFADKNVGDSKVVGITGISITGADAINYSLVSATSNTTANITPKALT
ncbi:MAG: filamentous hemagglutinin N-terminal domain-containing protein, partial [Betaproteobacteria bacterium]|nr:filamentous hemagglutinin N-terminal domain-containing protein [Betaproteobacteria bacterium]